MMVLASELMLRCSPLVAALIGGSFLLLPLLLFFFIPSPPPSDVQARESFVRFWSEAAMVIRRREVFCAMLLFLFPCASFALTNVLGATGRDFAASDHQVGIYAGFGGIIAGILGSFVLYPLATRYRLRPLYLSVGVVGAAFTLSLLLIPRAPWAFGVAVCGENMFQALAFSVSNAIAFEIVGPDNPYAATLFSLMIATSNFPITYMQYIDGRGYGFGGLSGSLVTDAAFSAIACLLVWQFVLRPYQRNRANA